MLQVMQGSGNQMLSPMPQGSMMGLNQMHAGPVTTSNIPPVGGFSNGITNIQGATNAAGLQNFPLGGMFNRPQGGQIGPIPGLNAYQVQNDHLFPDLVNGICQVVS